MRLKTLYFTPKPNIYVKVKRRTYRDYWKDKEGKVKKDICNGVPGFCNIQEVRRFPCLGNGSMDCRYAGSYDSFEWR